MRNTTTLKTITIKPKGSKSHKDRYYSNEYLRIYKALLKVPYIKDLQNKYENMPVNIAIKSRKTLLAILGNPMLSPRAASGGDQKL